MKRFLTIAAVGVLALGLSSVAQAYRSRRDEVDDNASRIVEALSRRPQGAADEPPGRQCAAQAAMRLLQQADPQHGGFGGAPKFPRPHVLGFLLRMWVRRRDPAKDLGRPLA